jgi:hypothetical protein
MSFPVSLHTYKFVNMRFITVITQFRDTMAMNCPPLTCCMKMSYAVGHELAGSLPFQRLVFILSYISTWICEVYCHVMDCHNRRKWQL